MRLCKIQGQVYDAILIAQISDIATRDVIKVAICDLNDRISIPCRGGNYSVRHRVHTKVGGLS